MLTGKILVTGGSGFLARGLYRRARMEGWDAQFTCYSRGEHAQDLIGAQYPEVRRVLGDVRDLQKLKDITVGHDVIIHAGALKRVPEAEYEPVETVKTNVLGSMNVIEAAKQARVANIIAISTDKAVQGVNTYGKSKAIMEAIFTDASSSDTAYKCVRYGNVVGSTGSVIPLFQRQKRELGRLTVTDPDMTRFWMSVDEAIDCIIFALEHGSPGGIIVPRPRSMSIGTLANVIADGDPIDIIGQRPGEKTHEELVHFQESVRVKTHNRSYYELLPVRTGFNGSEPFMVSSLYAEKIDPAEMVLMISDAEDV